MLQPGPVHRDDGGSVGFRPVRLERAAWCGRVMSAHGGGLGRVARRLRVVLVPVVILCGAGCVPYASVSSVRPGNHRAGGTAGGLAPVDRQIGVARRQAKDEPVEAIGGFLTAAWSAQQELARDPGNVAARDAYNFAVARVIGTARQAGLDPWTRPLSVPVAGGRYELTCEAAADRRRHPARYHLTPVDELRIGGAYIRERQRKAGVGAPVVAVGRGDDEPARGGLWLSKLCYGVTAVIRFEGGRAVISLEDPLATERVSLAGHDFPLAADFTAPIAVLLARQDVRKLEFAGLLRPDDGPGAARLAFTQPYDPRKTVVLIIHGLKDTPATWVPMINRLQADPELRRAYQVWFYGYPSGWPYSHSAAMLRRELDGIGRRHPQHGRMVVIGHSMGGCISRLLVTDTGDRLWRGIFHATPEETPLPAASKALLREELIFRHRPEIGRVIFIAAPLRGSEMARGWIGRAGSTLVQLPSRMLDTGDAAVRALTFQPDELRLNRAPNSVDLLTPDNRFVRAIQTIPVTPGIPHHVICGDRGLGGHRDRTKPAMSDGVVPYWSSHMETAASELIVPSGHSVHQHPDAITEVARILKLHAHRLTEARPPVHCDVPTNAMEIPR